MRLDQPCPSPTMPARYALKFLPITDCEVKQAGTGAAEEDFGKERAVGRI
jgi:hypothetical protein